MSGAWGPNRNGLGPPPMDSDDWIMVGLFVSLCLGVFISALLVFLGAWKLIDIAVEVIT